MDDDRIQKYSQALGCDYKWFREEYYRQPLIGVSLYDGKIGRGIMNLYAHLDEEELTTVLDFCIENDMSVGAIRIQLPQGTQRGG